MTKKRGRPSGLSAFSKREKEIIYKCCELWGATDKQIAELCKVTEQTVNNWKLQDPDFFESLKNAKQLADARVERSLYERAIGYACPDTYFANNRGEIIATEYTKHYPPDTTAGIFWLKNRQPEVWRDQRNIEHSGKVDTTPVLYVVDQIIDADESDSDTEGSESIH